MSLVVFPVKNEDPAVVVTNLRIAAAHPRVEEVWAVISGVPADDIAHEAGIVGANTGKSVSFFPQERLGSLRPGKGDAMNIAILRSAERRFERTHFYDVDITNFDGRWIDGAEDAADRGFSVVRHRFPRAATDAMITWMVTRPALAFLFPGTFLPRLGQLLGGELLIGVDVVRALAGDDTVRERSDWGVDTMLTYAESVLGTSVYEHDLADGKRHALYGSLWELRTMVLECLDTVASLAGRPPPPPGSELATEPSSPVPDELKKVRGFDLEATMALLGVEPANEEIDLAARLPDEVGERAMATAKGGGIEFMDADTWGTTLRFLLAEFELGDPAWEALAFRLWLIRVLAYANGPAREGYDRALDYLETSILHYEGQADQDVRA